MTEKPNFFYKETPQGQRIDLSNDFMNAFSSNFSLNSLPQLRKTEK